MSIPRLSFHNTSPLAECHFGFHGSTTLCNIAPHNHSFYEMFLVTEGAVRHMVNDVESCLTEGDCVLIRPDDIHWFSAAPDMQVRIVNIEFKTQLFEALITFLGNESALSKFASLPFPPHAHLRPSEKERVQAQLEELNRIPVYDIQTANMNVRALLADIFTRHFCSKHSSTEAPTMPEWLAQLCDGMNERSNFVDGVRRMVGISHKSLEHLCRSFRKYLGKTPSQFVNSLRLNYAANLLTHSDAKISWIARQSGFTNMGHFYMQFAREFGVTPSQFRKGKK